MDLNGWTPIPIKKQAANESAHLYGDYTLRISGSAARSLAAAGYAEAYANAERQIALRPADTPGNNTRRVTRTGEASAKLTITYLRALGYRPGQDFTIAPQGDMFVLTPKEAR